VFGTGPWPQKLIEAGFRVRCFAERFNKDGRKTDSVKDPQILQYCNSENLILVTLDKAIRHTHVEEIKKTQIGIIATESNKDGLEAWIIALIRAKPRIERLWKKFPSPWFAHLSKSGEIRQVQTITEDMETRRTRPREKG
jgi:hypothetical protein